MLTLKPTASFQFSHCWPPGFRIQDSVEPTVVTHHIRCIFCLGFIFRGQIWSNLPDPSRVSVCEAIACLASHHFYTDQPELALRFYRRMLQNGVVSAVSWSGGSFPPRRLFFLGGHRIMRLTCVPNDIHIHRIYLHRSNWIRVYLYIDNMCVYYMKCFFEFWNLYLNRHQDRIAIIWSESHPWTFAICNDLWSLRSSGIIWVFVASMLDNMTWHWAALSEPWCWQMITTWRMSGTSVIRFVFLRFQSGQVLRLPWLPGNFTVSTS